MANFETESFFVASRAGGETDNLVARVVWLESAGQELSRE